jgi:hypothetical protein
MVVALLAIIGLYFDALATLTVTKKKINRGIEWVFASNKLNLSLYNFGTIVPKNAIIAVVV